MKEGLVEAPRDRILKAATALLAEGGRDAVSTRSVSAAAAVQPQTIYRQFGDMQGLLTAVAKEGFATYLAAKTSSRKSADPVDDLREGWNLHIQFGLENPALYRLMYGDPRPGIESVTADINDVLRSLLFRVALAGRLKVHVDKAARIILAASVGTVLSLIDAPARNDTAISEVAQASEMRDLVLDALVASSSEVNEPTVVDASLAVAQSCAVTLSAALPAIRDEFSTGEFGLLTELLDRVARRGPRDNAD